VLYGWADGASVEQSTALKGLSRFLVAHEPCGAGFDVSHPAGLGSGRVSMTCRGCGQTYEYATATIEFEREIELEPLATDAAAPANAAVVVPPLPPSPPPPPELEALPEAGPEAETGLEAEPEPEPPPPESKQRGQAHRLRDRTIVAALLVFAFAALAYAGVRLAHDRSSSSSSTGAGGGTTAAAPATATGQGGGGAAKQGGTGSAAKAKRGSGTGTTKQAPAQRAKPATRPAAGEKLVSTARFSLIVPRDWTRRTEGDGLLLSAPGGAGASIWAFYESNPRMSLPAMSEETARYLRSRAADGSLSGPTRLRVGGHPAFELRDRGPSGSQTARGVLADPYRYLALEEVRAGAPASARAAADRALRSFRPR
jgi:hypothetical protein